MQGVQQTSEIERIFEARHHDPFAVLGKHPGDGGEGLIRAFIPNAREVSIVEVSQALERVPGTDMFEWRGDTVGA